MVGRNAPEFICGSFVEEQTYISCVDDVIDCRNRNCIFEHFVGNACRFDNGVLICIINVNVGICRDTDMTQSA